VCLDPALDEVAARKHGYRMDTYYRGSMDGRRFVGWSGAGDTPGYAAILEDLLTVSPKMLLLSAAFYIINGTKSVSTPAKISHLAPVYPYGRCVQVGPPLGVNHRDIHFLNIIPNRTALAGATTQSTVLTVHLRDPVNSAFQMTGDPIEIRHEPGTPENQYEFMYKIRISRSYHVPGDPRLQCTEYSTNHSYAQCIQRSWPHSAKINWAASPRCLQGRTATFVTSSST
jgi:hypothetical protein